jgi:hypothetical protein
MAQHLRATDSVAGIGEVTVAPAPDLVTEPGENAEKPAADIAVRHDPTCLEVGVGTGPHGLDDEPTFREMHLKGCVEQGHRLASF